MNVYRETTMCSVIDAFLRESLGDNGVLSKSLTDIFLNHTIIKFQMWDSI